MQNHKSPRIKKRNYLEYIHARAVNSVMFSDDKTHFYGIGSLLLTTFEMFKRDKG